MRRAAVLVLAVGRRPPARGGPGDPRPLHGRARTATATFGTATLAAPTSLAGAGGTSATLTWVPSTSSGATGYYLMRSGTSGSGYTQVKTVTPVTPSSTTDAPANGTWYYVLQTYLQGWTQRQLQRGVGSSSARRRPPAYKGCASDQRGGDDRLRRRQRLPDQPRQRVRAGRRGGDRQELGNRRHHRCTSTGKDRHRFWGYAFGLPASRQVDRRDHGPARRRARHALAGASAICVELSWDSGATWTAAQAGQPHLHGHHHLHAGRRDGPLGPRLDGGAARHIDVPRPRHGRCRNTSRDFGLDYLGVQVNYTP